MKASEIRKLKLPDGARAAWVKSPVAARRTTIERPTQRSILAARKREAKEKRRAERKAASGS